MILKTFEEYIHEDFNSDGGIQFEVNGATKFGDKKIIFYEELNAPINLYKYMKSFDSQDAKTSMKFYDMYTCIVFVNKHKLLMYVSSGLIMSHNLLCTLLDKNYDEIKKYPKLTESYKLIYMNAMTNNIKTNWCFSFYYNSKQKIETNLSKMYIEELTKNHNFLDTFIFNDSQYKDLGQ